MYLRLFLATLATVGLASCGSNNQPLPVPGPLAAPQVTLAISPGSVQPGQQATLSWSATDAASCVASGSWSGTQPTTGSTNVSLQGTADQTFTLACTGSGGNVSQVAHLSVAQPPGGCAPKPAAVRKGDRRTSRTRGLPNGGRS
jgi:hypothetical protein